MDETMKTICNMFKMNTYNFEIIGTELRDNNGIVNWEVTYWDKNSLNGKTHGSIWCYTESDLGECLVKFARNEFKTE